MNISTVIASIAKKVAEERAVENKIVTTKSLCVNKGEIVGRFSFGRVKWNQ